MKFADLANDPALDQRSTPKSSFAQEFVHLWLLARSRWSRGARPWLAITVAVASVLVALFLHFDILRPELWRSGDVYAALPLTSELSRLPMSLLFPTAYLPLWGACLQLVVVIGLGEMILGRWMTIVIATMGHFGSTLIARLLLESFHSHILGLTPALAHVLDTGPSAATTAVGACVLVAARMNRSALLLSVGLIAAAIIAPGVDGFEHTTALIIGLTTGAIYVVMISNLSQMRVWWKTLWGMLHKVPRASQSLRRILAGVLIHNDAR